MKAKRSIFNLAIAMILCLTALPSMAADPRPGDPGTPPASNLTVEGYEAQGPTVQVEVLNSTSQSQLAWLRVDAQVGGQTVISLTPISLAGNQGAQVTAGFAGTVEGIIAVGIQDSPVPI